MRKNTANLIISFLVIGILAAATCILGVITDWFKDWSKFTGVKDEAEKKIEQIYDDAKDDLSGGVTTSVVKGRVNSSANDSSFSDSVYYLDGVDTYSTFTIARYPLLS